VKIRLSDPCPCGSGDTFGNCHDRQRREGETPLSDLKHMTLNVISPPDPGDRAVFEMTDKSNTVLFSGISGQHSLDCGNCFATLASRVNREQFRGVVLRCNGCGAYNDT
jgi:hypothetical protein